MDRWVDSQIDGELYDIMGTILVIDLHTYTVTLQVVYVSLWIYLFCQDF